MPCLPTSYYSNYYTVQFTGAFYSFLTSLGFTPTIASTKQYMIAKNFEQKIDDSATKKTFIQGLAGHLVQDVKTPHYSYVIEAPMLITNLNSTNFLTYNSLSYFGINWANAQISYLNTNTISLTAVDILLEEFSISATENDVMQKLVIKSSIDLVANGFITVSRSVSSDIYMIISRLVKNYDIFVNPVINGVSMFTSNSIFLEESNFNIKFDLEPKYFYNAAATPRVTFLIKGYDVTHKYGVVGLEANTTVIDWTAGGFSADSLRNVLLFGGASATFLDYTLPMVVKTKSYKWTSDALVKTDFDFSMYAYPYSASTPFTGFA